MATRTSRPARTLLVFAIVIGVLYITVAALGNWKPKLGLDLQGGTRITLQAQAVGGTVTSEKLTQAKDIISARVNGSGVSEAEVTTQGNDIVIIEIPGKVDSDLAQTIGETAQLRFRVVAAAYPPAQKPTTPTSPTDTSPTGTAPTGTTPTGTTPTGTTPTDTSPTGTTPTTGSTTGPKAEPPASGATSSSAKNRVAPHLDALVKPRAPVSTKTAAPLTPVTAGPDDAKGDKSVEPPAALQPPDLLSIPDPLAWTANPPAQWTQQAATYVCPKEGQTTDKQLDVPSQPLLACDDDGYRYLLGPAMVEGTDVDNANAGIPQGQVAYAVTLDFNSQGTRDFGKVTTATAKSNPSSPNTGKQVAIVLDGEVLSAPTNDEPILGGQAVITGSVSAPFSQASATSLANSLKYGALPLTFTLQDVTTEGPELAGSQLDAGIIAGIVGLILVVAYCLLYYRGLAIVVVSSLLIAGLIIYAMVLLLGHAYGFTLTLPGIAGLIVAVGITADSFIVYFERLRDEVRDGKTLRTSVESGWVRARSTILAADAVSMLAALVLFIFAIGVVKGFAFALGLTTFIDVFVVFFFTKPVVTLLARTKFFGQGHKWSGLDRQHLGMPPLKPRTQPARGEA